MKKLFLPILILLMALPALSQNLVSISGTVTDIVTGTPIPNHAVIILNDSSGGWIYHQTVYTNNSGYYLDTVPVPVNTQGILYVRTIDCQNYYHQAVITYMPSVLSFTVDFPICNSNTPCDANYTTQQQLPLTVQFTDASAGGGTLRLWDFGDGSGSTEMNPVHQYAQRGYRTVRLTIGAEGTPCFDVTSQALWVWDSIGGGECQAAFMAYSYSNTVYAYRFCDMSRGDSITQWTWDFGDGLTQTVTYPAQPNVTHVYAQPGTYLACLTVTGNDSTCHDTWCNYVVVEAGGGCHAAFQALPDSGSNPPLLFHFIDQSSGNNILSWLWDFGDPASGVNNFSTTQNPYHAYSQAGTYTVCLTIQGADSTCSDMTCQTLTVTYPTCVANFSFQQYAVRSFQFVDQSMANGSPVTWGWDFGDGGTSAEQNPIHIYNANGWYAVTLSINNPATGCYDHLTRNVFATDSTGGGCHAAFTVIPDSVNNPPMTYQFINQSSGNNLSTFIWSFGDGTSQTITFPGNPNVDHTYAQTGLYYACLTIMGADSSCFDVTCDSIFIPSPPDCHADFTTQQQVPLTVNFFDASTGGGNIRQWAFDDGETSTLINPVHTFLQSGYHMVALTIGALGTTCYNSITQTIYVWDSTGGGCQAAFIAVPDSMNTMNTFHFYDQSSGNIVSWEWNFGDPASGAGNTSGLQNPVHSYSQPGYYVACLKIQGADSSCFDITCDTLFVGQAPGCQAAFGFYADSTNASTTYHFIDQSAGNIVGWDWNFGDPGSGGDNFSSQQNPVHNFSAAGSYSVCLTIHGADSLCYDVTCLTVVVQGGSGCQAYFSYAVDPALGDHTIQFTDLSTGPPASWFWNFGDGTSSTVQNPLHTFAGASLSHTVCLTITGNNCTSTLCKEVLIGDSSTYHQVYGQVFAGEFPISEGIVMIFSYDTNANYQPYIGVFPVDSNGVYYFTTVPDGNYYVLAIPFNINGYLPTYYGNTINWEQATLISLGTESNPYDIHLVLSGSMTYGPGSTSGQINMSGLKTTMMDKINMILMNEQGAPIGFTNVSTSGVFNFPSMAYGTYYLHPEMPGVASDQIKVILTPEKPHADVVMTFDGNKILGMSDETALVNRWSVYPNPVAGNLTVSIDMKQGTKAEIEIYNLAGQQVLVAPVTLHSGSNIFEFATATLPAGVYSLRIVSDEGLNINTKLVKTR